MIENVEGFHTEEAFGALVKVANHLIEEEGLPRCIASWIYPVLGIPAMPFLPVGWLH